MQWRNDLPASAMALSSLGSLGLRCNFRLDMEEDLPRLKNERQLPTGDFLDLIGGLFLKMKMEGGGQTGKELQNSWACSQVREVRCNFSQYFIFLFIG